MSPQKTEIVPAKTKSSSPAQAPKTGIEYSRTDDFAELYANSVACETSLWDLKLVFGQNDQHIGPNAIVQHTAVTIPWAQVKVLLYTFSLLLTDQEGRSGRIQLKKGLIGELPKQMPQQARDSGEVSEETWRKMRALYEDLIAANPELI
jgi:hypothetical protein